MTDKQFYAAISEISRWLKANDAEAVTRHLRRHFPEVIIMKRRPKWSRLTGEMR